MPLCIVYRCCVSERIPDSYLYQVRKKYLDFDTRAQRKEYLLSCKDPRSRLLYIHGCLFYFLFFIYFLVHVGTVLSWYMCKFPKQRLHLVSGVVFLWAVEFSLFAGKVFLLFWAAQRI